MSLQDKVCWGEGERERKCFREVTSVKWVVSFGRIAIISTFRQVTLILVDIFKIIISQFILITVRIVC